MLNFVEEKMENGIAKLVISLCLTLVTTIAMGQLSAPVVACTSVNAAGAITLTWSQPADPGGIFAGYELYEYNVGTGASSLITTITNYNTTSYTIPGYNGNIVAEGFEAGGHNGKDETTTLCLIPQVVDTVTIPVIAAGGIADGRSMLAAMALGAEGVQIGSRFVASAESSAHNNFKQAVVDAHEGDTELTLKELTPVRLLKNEFYQKIMTAYSHRANKNDLVTLLGKGRAKLGMFDGDLNEGELEIGQVSASIHQILPAGEIVRNILSEYENLGGQKLGGYFDFKATK